MSAPENRPFLVIIAGPNGSGKSTLTQWPIKQGVDFGVYINPDEIAATLEGAYDDRVKAAQSIADKSRADCIRDRKSFSFETVMSHPSKLDVLREAKAAGYFVQMFFVATDDPLINVSRVANRVAKGGHDVPADKIIERYKRVLAMLPEALLICDAATIFDNSDMMIKPWLVTTLQDERLVVEARNVASEPDPTAWIKVVHARAPEWIEHLAFLLLANSK